MLTPIVSSALYSCLLEDVLRLFLYLCRCTTTGCHKSSFSQTALMFMLRCSPFLDLVLAKRTYQKTRRLQTSNRSSCEGMSPSDTQQNTNETWWRHNMLISTLRHLVTFSDFSSSYFSSAIVFIMAIFVLSLWSRSISTTAVVESHQQR